MLKQRLLIVGCGDIALRLVRLLGSRYRVYALTHSPERFDLLRAAGVVPLRGDLDDAASLSRIAGLAHAIVHFAPPPKEGRNDRRTRNLLAALGKANSVPQRLVFISTSGVYGDCGGAVVDETRPISPDSARAVRRADAERRLRAWGRSRGVNVSILRVPGIYAAYRLPMARIEGNVPALNDADDGYSNHIHAEDLARIALAALRSGRPNRVYHASDDEPMKMGDYFDLLADHFSLPRPPRVSWQEAQESIPRGLLSFMGESRRLTNERIKRELGVKLVYPSVRDAIVPDDVRIKDVSH